MKYFLNKQKKHVAVLLLLAALLTLSACGSDGDLAFRRVGNPLYTDSLTVLFREGDSIRDIVEAALSELSASGQVAELSARWLASREVSISADTAAISALPEETPIPDGRIFIMGFDENTPPRAFVDAGVYTGFDVALARLVCEKLGWRLRLQPISADNVKVELESGNVDCAWGFPLSAAKGLSALEPYIDSDVSFVVNQDSDIKRQSHFKDKSLYLTSQAMKDYIESSEDFAETFSRIRVFDSAKQCFDELKKGNCDVILVDSFALEQNQSVVVK